MKKVMVPALMLVALLFSFTNISAQAKYGHVNLGNLIAGMNETKW